MLDWWDSKFLVTSQLRGVFLGDESYPALDNHIFLLYQFKGDRQFTWFERTLTSSEYLEITYEPDKTNVMFAFNVPDRYQSSYDYFKDSKYSKMDEILKMRILNFWSHDKWDTSQIEAILYKHESQYLKWENEMNEGLPYKAHTKIPRSQEAAPRLNMEAEIYGERFVVKPKGLSPSKDF